MFINCGVEMLLVCLVYIFVVLVGVFYGFLCYYNFRFWVVGRGVLRFWEG